MQYGKGVDYRRLLPFKDRPILLVFEGPTEYRNTYSGCFGLDIVYLSGGVEKAIGSEAGLKNQIPLPPAEGSRIQ